MDVSLTKSKINNSVINVVCLSLIYMTNVKT